jgi:hypothetical protein
MRALTRLFAHFFSPWIFSLLSSKIFSAQSRSPQELPGSGGRGSAPKEDLDLLASRVAARGRHCRDEDCSSPVHLETVDRIVSVLPPMMTSKDLGQRRRTTYGPLYSGENGDGLVPLNVSRPHQLIRYIRQRPPVRKIHTRQHQAEILGKAAEKLVDEEDVALLAPGADPQHLSKKLRRFLSSQGWHLLDELHLLIICELMSCQEPGLQLRVRVSWQRRLHEVRHEVDCGRAVRTL